MTDQPASLWGSIRARPQRALRAGVPSAAAIVGCMLAVLVAGAVEAASAQPGSITGRVTDAQGAALAGVTVTASAPPSPTPAARPADSAAAQAPGAGPADPAPVAASAESGADGTYALAVAPGVYSVTFTRPGFAPRQDADVSVAPGEVRVLDAALAVAGLAEQVDVVGVSPLPGAGLRRDRVPAAVSVLDGGALAARGAASMADALHERLGAVTLEGTTTNQFQPTLRFRGFSASPLLGLPQGIAVYQNGVRINEPFGDTVQFDLMPQFAVDRVQLSAGADPTFGLNALGGALALDLKNGFDHPGARAELAAGAFGRLAATADYGVRRGRWAFYGGATRLTEDGWRVESPSEVAQAFADVGYRADRLDAGVSVTWADTRLNGNAPAPVELLDVDRTAVFTFPDTTENRLAFVQGRANAAAAGPWSIQVTGYYRDLDRRTLNGDEADFGVCDDAALPAGAPDGTLCFGGGDDDDDDLFGDAADGGAGRDVGAGAGQADADADAGDADAPGAGDDDDDDADDAGVAAPIVDLRTGEFITRRTAAGDAAFNRTSTRAQGYGATVQATAAAPIGGRGHVLVLGASADLADVAFGTSSEIGSLTPARGVDGSGRLAALYGFGGDDLFNTGIETASRAVGIYAHDTLALADRVDLTVAGRYTRARLDITDLLGDALDGAHTFARFNPSVGVVVRPGAGAAVFARYAESNRAPTAAELSCADPAEPCRIPNAFVSDPPLEQAVARSVEAGVRGEWTPAAGRGAWSVTAYRTRIDDDILFVASPRLIGSGYFQNAGATARTGLDVELTGEAARTGWYVSYGLVHATFASPLQLPGDPEVNAAATAAGALAVEPGDRLPGIPRHSVKAGVRVALTGVWDAALEAVAASSRVFVGDEGNDQAPLDGYGVLTLRSSYRLAGGVELFVRVDNLLDARYATAGVLAELELPLREAPAASDPRFIGPGPPRSALAGLRVQF